MKKMKLLALSLCLSFALCACGGENSASNNGSADKPANEQSNEDTNEEAKTEDKEETSNTESSVAKEDKVEIPVADIFEEIKENVELYTEEPEVMTDRQIENYLYGIITTELEEYVFYAPIEGESAERIFIVKTNGSDQADSVKGILDGYRDELNSTFESYGENQGELVAASSVEIRGDYVIFVVSEKAAEIMAIIDKHI